MRVYKYSASLFSAVVTRIGGKDEAARAMNSARAFVDRILRGETPIPARQALRLSQKSGIDFQKFMEAFLKDQETAYGSAVKIPKGDS